MSKRATPSILRWAPLLLLGAGAVVFVLWKELAPVPEPVEPDDLSLVDSEVRPILERELEKARANPASGEAHGTLGMVYEANGLWSEAERAYANAARLDGGNALWRLHRGIALSRLGRFDEARVLFEGVLDDPACAPAAHHRLGEIDLDAADLRGAEESFRQAQRRAPNAPEPRVGLAAVLVRNGDHARAEKELAKALEIDPDYKQARYLLGMAYRGLGRMEEARRELALGAVSDRRYLPDPLAPRVAMYRVNVASQIDQAQALIRAGNPDGLRLLERLHEGRPSDTNVINNLAIALMGEKQHARALGLLRRAKSLRPDDFPTWINLASCLLEMKQYDEALEHAERAAEMAPEVASPYLIRGKLMVVKNRLNEAYPDLRTAARLDADNPDAQFLFGEVCAATARYPEAREALEATTRLAPRHLMAHVKLCRVLVELGDLRGAEAALVAARGLSPDAQAVRSIGELVAQRKRGGG